MTFGHSTFLTGSLSSFVGWVRMPVALESAFLPLIAHWPIELLDCFPVVVPPLRVSAEVTLCSRVSNRSRSRCVIDLPVSAHLHFNPHELGLAFTSLSIPLKSLYKGKRLFFLTFLIFQGYLLKDSQNFNRIIPNISKLENPNLIYIM